MNKNVLTFKEMQEFLWDKFIKINKEFLANDLVWWIHSGTLLGIVREKGLIPWDDDVDMGMRYIDYLENKDLIKKLAKKHGMRLVDNMDTLSGETLSFIECEKPMKVDYKGSLYEFKPRIDIMFAIPNYSKSIFNARMWTIPWHLLKNKLLWNEYRHNKRKIIMIGYNAVETNILFGFLYNSFRLVTPTKIIFCIVKRKYKKTLKGEKNWRNVQFWFSMSENKYVFDFEKIEKQKFINNEFYATKDYKKELEYWYGPNWTKRPPLKDQKALHILKYKK